MRSLATATALLPTFLTVAAICIRPIAAVGQDTRARRPAGDSTADQALLALWSPDYYVRMAAIAKLTDQGALARVAAMEDNGAPEMVVGQLHAARPYRLAAIAKLTDQRVLADLGGGAEPEGAAARVVLALQDPVIAARVPDAKLATTYMPTSETYERGPIPGEHITFSVRQAPPAGAAATSLGWAVPNSRERILASDSWTTSFPEFVHASAVFLAPRVDVSGILRQLIMPPEFEQEDFVKLALSNIPEVRAAASAWLTTGQPVAQLAKIVIEDKDYHVRSAAAQRLTDQALLARIAVEDKSYVVRIAAAKTMADQSLLAKIALEDKDSVVRIAAAKEITAQVVLAKLAQDGNPVVRQVATEGLTDQVLIGKIALGDEAPVVRQAAAERLTDQTLLGRIALDDKYPHVRKAAEDRLAELRAGKQ